jgi:hypothetical protein
MSGVERKGERWLVGTFGSVPRDTAGEKDILFLPHAEEATGARAVDMIAGTGFRRRYAFVRPGRRPMAVARTIFGHWAGWEPAGTGSP